MLTLEKAKNPVYSSVDKQSIDLMVKWSEFDREMPFTATSYDVMGYGRDLFKRASDGEFGLIGDYVEPPPPPMPI